MALVAYIATFAWGVASESYAARFWVFVIPILIYGTIYWISEVHTPLKWAVVLPLSLITLVNASLFVDKPSFFLENRFGSLSYEYLYQNITGIININLITAADPYDARYISTNTNANVTKLISLLTIVTGLVTSGFYRVRKIGVATCFLVMFIAAYYSLLIPISPSEYEITRTKSEGALGWIVTIDFKRPTSVHGLQFGNYADVAVWGNDPSTPREFVVSGTNSDGKQIESQTVSGFQLTSLLKPAIFSSLIILVHNPPNSTHWHESKIKPF